MTADLAIVGAGPAGMAAAALAAGLGLDTVLIDEQQGPGGQIYRAIEQAEEGGPLGADYLAGRPLAAELRASKVRYLPSASVWHIDPQGVLYIDRSGHSETLAARHILLAAGAIERPVPIPGWTLPGVMTVGAAQILLKTAGIVPEGRVVLAGQGPLLYLVALQLARAGAPPAALLLTTPSRNYREAARQAGALWPGRRRLFEGLAMIAAVRRAGIPVRHGVRGLTAVGRGRIERVLWQGGETACDHLLLHEGVIPNVQASLALQLHHEWDEAQLCWRPALGPWGETSEGAIAIAGDMGGISGAAAAALSGRLAVLGIAARLGRIDDNERGRRARPLRAALAREQAFRPFLDRLYRPAPWALTPEDDGVIACRCEEVTAGQIRSAARLGASGPNQLKAFTRCGMGPCQGRICGPIVAAILAETLGRPIAEIGTYRPRAPLKPITVGALADLAMEETAAS
jgi:NADPH-dependent 2,4-dienoyl-CoA reductase/sulfur reductase-like enzyme